MDHTSDPTAARWPVDPDRLDLVQEFRHRIRGPHSPDLQKLIARLRWGPIAGRYVVLTLETGRRWMLARQRAERGEKLELFENHVFTSLEDAEWEVFKRRWEEATGRRLKEDGTAW